MFDHRIRVAIGETALTGAGLDSEQIQEFEVTSDMLELADPFNLKAPLTRELWDSTGKDALVRVFIDDSQVLEGYIDGRERGLSRAGSTLTIAGRDKGGRLVDESAPLLKYAGRTLQDFAAELVAPWFPTVAISNAKNRALIRGRGRALAAVASEPPLVVDTYNEDGELVRPIRKVEPGDSVASVLAFFLEKGHMLGWSSADGRQFVLGRPNYNQAPQFFFFLAAAGSPRANETNVEELVYREDLQERYSEIKACGTGKGDASNYASNVLRRQATAIETDTFLHRKRLLLTDDDIRSVAGAQARADREMALRESSGWTLELSVKGFGQALGGDPDARPALFACDTIARFEDEELDLRGDWLITRVVYRRSKGTGDRTNLTLVPRGTALVFG